MTIKKIGLWLSVVALFCVGENAFAQKMAADGKFGLSIFSGGGNSSTGLLFGGALDLPIGENLFARPELNITTHGGTPIELGGGVKYYIPSAGSTTPYYVDGGLGLWFYSGGPYVGLDFTGGAIFPLSGSNLKIPAEIRIGPIFASGSTVFQIALTSGLRFSLP
jgi:hypothetical protein